MHAMDHESHSERIPRSLRRGQASAYKEIIFHRDGRCPEACFGVFHFFGGSFNRFAAAPPPETGMRRTALFSWAALGLSLILFLLIKATPGYRTPLFYFAVSIGFFGMLGFYRSWNGARGAVSIMVIAFAARLFMLPLTPNDDINRYLWEGKMQHHGLNPFAVSIDGEQTVPFRDSLWQEVAHKQFTTIYGPLAQTIFFAATLIRSPVFSFKLILLLFDLGTLALLLRILEIRRLPKRAALLYAINPLVLFSFCAEGHLECIMMFFLAAALFTYDKKRFFLMFVFLGCAISVKLTAVMYLACFIRRDTIRYLPALLFASVFALPYGRDVVNLIAATFRFGTHEHFNGFVFEVAAIMVSEKAALLLCSTGFAVAYFVIVTLRLDVVKAAGSITFAFLLASPNSHPWYFASLCMLSSLYSSPPWVALGGTATASWNTTFQYARTGIWFQSSLVTLLEYLIPLSFFLAGRRKKCSRGG